MRNLLTLLAFIVISFNADAEVLAQIDRNEVALGESVNLIISSDEQLNGQPDFSVLSDDFQVSAPSQSQNFVMRNGVSAINIAWTITLFPKKAGDLVIPAFEIDGKKTLPLLLKVSQSQQTNTPQDDIYITTKISKPELYVGEQSIITVKVYSSLNILSGQLEQPQFNGTKLSQLGEEKTYRSTQNGKNFKVIERNYLFYPSESGAVTIEPVSLIADLEQRNYRRKRVSRASSPIEINVLAKPDDYPVNTLWLPSPELTLKENWSDSDDYQVGTPITRTITLAATGLAKEQLPDLSEAKSLTDIANLKVYVDNSDVNSIVNQQGLVSTQVTKLAIIPEVAGEITLPAYQLTWFNTTTKQIETATLPERQIKVTAAAGTQTTTPPAVKQTQSTTETAGEAITKTPASSDKITDSTTTTANNADISELEKTVRFWQITSGVLALALCIAIAAAFGLFKRKAMPLNNKTKQPSTDFSGAYQLLASTNSKDKQLGLIRWWNLKYPNHAVSNISQISELVDDATITAAIDKLEASIYANGEADSTPWLEWVKKDKIKPAQTTNIQTNKLKPLY